MRGLVIRVSGNLCQVAFPDGSVNECHVKGSFRIRDIRSTNPVAIGDRVEVDAVSQTADSTPTYWITDICPRTNYIIRRSTNLSFSSHILAANVDLALLVVTLSHPATSLIFIDRFLATCQAYRVPAALVFNKADLITTAEQQQCLNELRDLYQSLGYPTLTLSAIAARADDQLLAPVRAMIADKVTLIAGNSGVGKSTLLNALFGQDMTRTGAISTAHDKGMHTTTFSQMYRLPFGGWLIDTPGIKGFGSLDMQPTEVCHYFRDIFPVAQSCRYSDCLHVDEPGCAVVRAVEQGQIAPSRYDSYLSMLSDKNETKYRH